MVITRNGNLITLVLSPEETDLVQWIDDTYGTNELNQVLSRYLEQKTAQKDETDKTSFWAVIKDHPDILQTALDMVASKKSAVPV